MRFPNGSHDSNFMINKISKRKGKRKSVFEFQHPVADRKFITCLTLSTSGYVSYQ